MPQVLLTDYGFSEERYSHLGNVYRSIPGDEGNYSEMTLEEIYERLPYSLYAFDEQTRRRFLPDNDLWWDQKEDIGKSGEIILDLPELDSIVRGSGEDAKNSSGEGEDLQQKWQARAACAVNSIESLDQNDNSTGNVPEFFKRMIEKMKEPTIDWKKALNNFIQERICDYSFSPPDRRFAETDFFLPDFNEKDYVSKEILFMVDTSGSVEDEELAIVYSEIRGAIEQFNGKLAGKLGFFDAEVTPPLPFESVSDLMRIIPYGGGDTDFGVIFEFIRINYRDELPACIIIFTDGFGPYPTETEAMGIPVLWIISNTEITPPFGKTTRLIPNNDLD